MVWDGLPVHWGTDVRTFLSGGAAQRLRLEQLPSYAPDLNPDEGVWNWLKYVEMKNLCCRSLDQLKLESGLVVPTAQPALYSAHVQKSCSRTRAAMNAGVIRFRLIANSQIAT